MSIASRLLEFADSKGLKNSAFESDIGVKPGYLKAQIRRESEIGPKILQNAVAKYPEINLRWLITGEGTMILGESKSEFDNDALQTFLDSTDHQDETSIIKYMQELQKLRVFPTEIISKINSMVAGLYQQIAEQQDSRISAMTAYEKLRTKVRKDLNIMD
ncbi:hypothetical protein [Reichenbachiella versicolor]|uniref:hypothetical protein n=1 Tax=Reichenbachiella versicolor TaxID=1821036 RepID=UPI000D6E0E70|nr:hypothetical protein [Reichenbachiella versicolor]